MANLSLITSDGLLQVLGFGIIYFLKGTFLPTIFWNRIFLQHFCGAMNKKIIITIDGWSSCGKSTLAKQLAKELGYVYIDSGAMYRAITLYFLRNDCDSCSLIFASPAIITSDVPTTRIILSSCIARLAAFSLNGARCMLNIYTSLQSTLKTPPIAASTKIGFVKWVRKWGDTSNAVISQCVFIWPTTMYCGNLCRSFVDLKLAETSTKELATH